MEWLFNRDPITIEQAIAIVGLGGAAMTLLILVIAMFFDRRS